MAKRQVDINDPLHIHNEMAMVDQKVREFYDSLTPEQKKKFSPYTLLKWGPSVYGSADLQTYYIMAFNENVNKHFFDIGKHPKLQWLVLTTCSPGMGKQKHYWVNASKKKEGGKLEKKLMAMLPDMKVEDIQVMVSVNSLEDIVKWLENNGFSDKDLEKLCD